MPSDKSASSSLQAWLDAFHGRNDKRDEVDVPGSFADVGFLLDISCPQGLTDMQLECYKTVW
jgi:hypothetical protein